MENSDSPEIDLRQDLAEYFEDLARYRMPFGKYAKAAIYDLPYEYLHWFVERGDGFPSGRLGELMEFVYQTKATGAEIIFTPLKQARGPIDPMRMPQE